MAMRYVLEGEWSGYVARQRRVVHREIVSPQRAQRLRTIHAILYTDGTTLNLSVRPALPRERIAAINGYSTLIREAEAAGKAVYAVLPFKAVL